MYVSFQHHIKQSIRFIDYAWYGADYRQITSVSSHYSTSHHHRWPYFVCFNVTVQSKDFVMINKLLSKQLPICCSYCSAPTYNSRLGGGHPFPEYLISYNVFWQTNGTKIFEHKKLLLTVKEFDISKQIYLTVKNFSSNSSSFLSYDRIKQS